MVIITKSIGWKKIYAANGQILLRHGPISWIQSIGLCCGGLIMLLKLLLNLSFILICTVFSAFIYIYIYSVNQLCPAKRIYLNCLWFVSCISLVSCHLQQNKHLWHTIPFWKSLQPLVQLCGKKKLSLMLFVVVSNVWHGLWKKKKMHSNKMVFVTKLGFLKREFL